MSAPAHVSETFVATPERELAQRLAAALKGAMGGDRGTLFPLFEECWRQPDKAHVLTSCALQTALVEIGALKREVAELKAAPRFKDCGVWSGLESYRPGDHVSTGGSFWGCLHANISQRPGKGDGTKYWRLVSKEGTPGVGDHR
jgi:hypothetical protein